MNRTATLAALADEHRLAIADAVALADLTPGALAQQLAMPTNLVAHHLRVLEAADVIERRRSEGDRRRSYVTLRWDNPIVAATVMPAGLAATRIVFVCTHNSARSQFAASLMAARSTVDVASAGTAPADQIHPHALAQLRAQGLAPVTPTPQAWSDVIRPTDMVVAVCDNAFESLPQDAPSHLHWSVPDPARSGAPSDFAAAFAALQPRVDRLAAALT